MEQLSLFPTPYRYIIDTSAILSQKPNELHRRTVHRSQWEKIDELIRNQEIVVCSEIYDEVKDKKQKANKIPQVCQKFNLDCINILELCEKEHWVF